MPSSWPPPYAAKFYKGVYKWAEVVRGDIQTSRTHGQRITNATDWVKQMMVRGDQMQGFTSVGRWRSAADALEYEAPVQIPWAVFDIDRDTLYDAWQDARRLASHLTEDLMLRSVLAGVSGSKGFHVYVSSREIGLPTFPDSGAAYYAMKDIMDGMSGGVEYDKNVCSPQTLIRVAGTRHPETDFGRHLLGHGARRDPAARRDL